MSKKITTNFEKGKISEFVKFVVLIRTESSWRGRSRQSAVFRWSSRHELSVLTYGFWYLCELPVSVIWELSNMNKQVNFARVPPRALVSGPRTSGLLLATVNHYPLTLPLPVPQNLPLLLLHSSLPPPLSLPRPLPPPITSTPVSCPIDQSINQSIDQSTNQFNQSIDQLFSAVESLVDFRTVEGKWLNPSCISLQIMQHFPWPML